jgi:hypothetical protein
MHLLTRDDKGTNVRTAARLLGRHDMVKMIDEFAMWQSVHELALRFQVDVEFEKIVASSLPKFKGMPNSTIVKKLQRMLKMEAMKDYFTPLPELICRNITPKGKLPMLSWLVEAQPALLKVHVYNQWTNFNVNEFAQPELFQVENKDPRKRQHAANGKMGLVSLVAHGKCKTESDNVVFTAAAQKILCRTAHDVFAWGTRRRPCCLHHEGTL